MKNRYSLSNKKFFATLVGAFLLANFGSIANAQEADDEQFIEKTASLGAPKTGVLLTPQLSIEEKASLLAAINNPTRIDKNRDKFRHPLETLSFFGLKPDAKVIEIWPGQGWYSDILANYLRTKNGQLIAAHFDTSTTNSQLVKDMVEDFKKHFANKPETFGNVNVVPFGPRSKDLAPPNSVDAVLTFRNIHNWMNQGWADKAFDDFYKTLKPGGILGIEEHRADNDSPQDPLAADGYVREDYVIDMAQDAGFVLIGRSEINSNSKDTKDHPFGVWTLPPVGRTATLGKPANPNFDQSKYLAIGESDRMTLVFMKPQNRNTKMTANSKPSVKEKFNAVKVAFGAPKQKVALKPKIDVETLPNLNTPTQESPKPDTKPNIITNIEANKTAIVEQELQKAKPVEAMKATKPAIVASDPKAVKVVLNPPKTQNPPIITEKATPPNNAKAVLPEFNIPDWVADKPSEAVKPVDNVNATPKDVEKAVEKENVITEIAKDIAPIEKPIIEAPKIAAKPKAKAKEVKKPDVKPAIPVVKSASKPAPKVVAKVEPKPIAKAPAKTSEKPVTKPAPKAEAKVAAKPVAKPPAKAPVKAAPKPIAKADTKTTAKPKVATKPAPAKKPEIKPAKPKNPNAPDWVLPPKKK